MPIPKGMTGRVASRVAARAAPMPGRGSVRLPSRVSAQAVAPATPTASDPQPKDISGTARDHEPARRARGRHRDRQGCRPRGRHEREARDHGPERLGQVDARLRADGPSGLRDHRGRHPLDGESILELGADERAQRGLFLAFQYPHAIPGVTVTSFLRSAINAKRKAANGGEDDPVPVKEFRTELLAAMEHLKVPRELAQRYLNDGFSGGEKKRVEILQMAMLKPRIAILDETDSGLDIDALRIVAEGVNTLVGPEMGALVITHYQRILNYVTPDYVHVFVDGRIVASGGAELAHKLEAEGYEAFIPAGVGGERRMSQSETEVVRDIRSDYEYGWHVDDVSTIFKAPKGLSHEVVDAISEHKSEPDWMRAFRHKSLDYFFARPMPTWGADLAGIDFENIHYYIKPTEKQVDKWEDLPAEILDTWDRLGIPEAEKKYLAGRRRPVRVRGRLPQAPGGSRAQGRDLPRHGLRPARARGARQAVLRDDHPAERQQVRRAQLGRLVGRVVHLRAAGRLDRDAAPGLLPHQRGEHGPVRAHADHRRRGRVRALRRGLHRADLLVRLAPLGGRRDHRQAARPLPLHDDPELVEQRLQPRHEARRRLRGRDDGVGRREPRLEGDDEVPGDLADGRARPRRGALDRVRRQGPASGRGRQGRPRREEHDERDHLEVDLEERRARRLPRPARGREGREPARSRRSSATR